MNQAEPAVPYLYTPGARRRHRHARVPAIGGRLVAILALFYRRARDRRELLGLDARQRRDIGVTAEQVMQEARKPFWRA